MQNTAKLFVALACTAAALLSACGKNASTDNAQIRFVHVSPDDGAINVQLAGETSNTVSAANFESISGYRTIASGTQEVKVSTVAGATQIDSGNSLTATGKYTYVIAGRVGANTGLLLLENTSSTSSNTFRIRVADVAYPAGALDLYVLSGTNTLQNSSPIFAGTTAGGTTSFIELTQGDYRLVFTPTGVKQAIYDSGVKTFANQASVTVLAYTAGSSQLVNAALIYPDESSTTFPANPYARIKTIQAIPDVALMDLLVDGTAQFSNVPYQGASGYLSLASGSRNFKVQATNVPGSYLGNSDTILLGGRDYSVVNIGSNGVVQSIALTDANFTPTSGKARVRFVNASLAAIPVDVLVNFVSETTNVAPNSASAYFELDASTYAFTFTASGSSTALLSLPSQTLTAGLRYSIYIVGTAANPSYIVVQDI